jgi:hypothetical protein
MGRRGGGTICTRYYACPALKNKKTRLSLHHTKKTKRGGVRGEEGKYIEAKSIRTTGINKEGSENNAGGGQRGGEENKHRIKFKS